MILESGSLGPVIYGIFAVGSIIQMYSPFETTMRRQVEHVNECIRRGYVYAYGKEARLHVVAPR